VLAVGVKLTRGSVFVTASAAAALIGLTILALALPPTGPAAERTVAATCTAAQKVKAEKALSTYRKRMFVNRRAYFRTHRSARDRTAFLRAQQRKLKALRAAAACTVPDPVIAAAGDIACDPASPAFNGGAGTDASCRQRYTSDLVVNQSFTAVLPLGDLQYEDATLAKFQQVFEPTWGRVKPLMKPVPGNHEYLDPGAAGYYTFFGSAAGDPSTGWYSYDLGKWHLIALNSEIGLGAGGAQDQWLKADLAAHKNVCTLAYWHRPRFSSVIGDARLDFFWQTLYAAGVDVVLNGHMHVYERFAPQTPSGQADPSRGIREFVVGTGGERHHGVQAIVPNSEVVNASTYGILSLKLRATGYDWQFLAESGGTFTDSGSASCH
jgi:calcineurin-like phosphoesterase family protein